METKKAKKEFPPSGNDRFSSLPDNTYLHILCYLPIRDAISTSLLSRDWKDRWKAIPKLKFESSSFKFLPGSSSAQCERKITDFINQVLLFHSGPIDTFEFTTSLKNCSIKGAWIHFLQKNKIENLKLEFGDRGKGKYFVSSCLFGCHMLITLTLAKCTIKIPHWFNGFASLRVLFLKFVTFACKDDIDHLVSKCPLLEQLTLKHCKGVIDLNINAPRLHSFEFRGTVRSVCLEGAPMLLYIKLAFPESVNSFHSIEKHGMNTTYNLIDVFIGNNMVEGLMLLENALQLLSVGDIPLSFSHSFNNLVALVVEVDLTSLQEIKALLCLVRSAPMLKILFCKVSPITENSIGNYWESGEWESKLNHLTTFTLLQLTGSES